MKAELGTTSTSWSQHHFCCDRKSRAACAQSFALWQQATIEIMLAISLTIACSRYIYNGVILHAHPVRGESHNQRNAIGEVATPLVQKIWGFEVGCPPLFSLNFQKINTPYLGNQSSDQQKILNLRFGGQNQHVCQISLKPWRLGCFGNFRKKNSSFWLPYQRPSSSADCARELFIDSNGLASLVDCTRKKIFCLGGAGFSWVTS